MSLSLFDKESSKNSDKGFNCAYCQKFVSYIALGTHHRNHCPFCLFSLHVDSIPGDRESICGGLMEPLGKFTKPDGEEMLVHKCRKCGYLRKNRIAGDDSWDLVAALPDAENPSLP